MWWWISAHGNGRTGVRLDKVRRGSPESGPAFRADLPAADRRAPRLVSRSVAERTAKCLRSTGLEASMADSLGTYLNEEFPAITTESRGLPLLAYDAVAGHQRSLDPRAVATDLSDEDVIARLHEPRALPP